MARKKRRRRRRSAGPEQGAVKLPSFASELERRSGLRQASFAVPERDIEAVKSAKRRFGSPALTWASSPACRRSARSWIWTPLGLTRFYRALVANVNLCGLSGQHGKARLAAAGVARAASRRKPGILPVVGKEAASEL